MAKDPICGMPVDEATALSAERGGKTFYFCSEHCREKFLGQFQPTPLAAEAEHGGHSHHGDEEHHDHSHHDHAHATVKPSAAAKYFCPMHPDVIADKPGSCPKCGMALERNPAWKAEEKVIYTCPMHPADRSRIIPAVARFAAWRSNRNPSSASAPEDER